MTPDDERPSTRRHVLDRMAVAMAGRAAERLVYGEDGFSVAGAGSDVRQATAIALQAVGEWGLGSLTAQVDLANWRPDPRADELAQQVDQFVKEAEQRAADVLEQHRRGFDALVERLLEVETLSGEEIVAVMEAGVTPQASSGS
jgi:cell division protease FtsH